MGDKGPCPVCGRWQNRPLVVDGLVMRDGKLLLVKRGREPQKGKFALPGGFVDWGETARDAVVREVLEESGLNCEIEGFVGYYDSPERDPGRMTVSLAFYCIPVDDKPPLAGDDADECGWFSLDELPGIAFDHLEIITDLRRIFGL